MTTTILPFQPQTDIYFSSSDDFFRKMQGLTPVRDAKVPLPDHFVPGPHAVLIGRGKNCANAIGNRRLRILASNFTEKYSKAQSRQEKSEVVTTIVDMIQEACGNIGAFVRFENGQWWEVEEVIAREKVGSVLRDCLHSHYKSSTKSKVAKRRATRNQLRSSTGNIKINRSALTSETSEDVKSKRASAPALFISIGQHLLEIPEPIVQSRD